MLGLLLLAGLGVAAAAFVDHVDSTAEDESEDQDSADLASGQATGDLLDDPPPEEEPAVQEPAEGGEPPAVFPEGESDEGSADLAPETGTDDPVADPASAEPSGQSAAVAVPVTKIYGTAGRDALEGTAGRDFMEGRAGADTLNGRGGNDQIVTFDAGQDRAWGGMGNDSLYGYRVNAMPGGDTSFVVEDHQVDHLHGGMGADKLWLASGDIGTGGMGQDTFHLSWDVDHANPAQITDYQPTTDRIVIEFTSHSVQGDMGPISDADQQVTTAALDNGTGTAILLNGQPIAHVMGTTTLQAGDISVVHR